MEVKEKIPEEQFWKNNAPKFLKPNIGIEYPEGFDILGILKEELGFYQKVLEVGCGEGRLCKAFSPRQYYGIDINEAVVRKASKQYPAFGFEVTSYSATYPRDFNAILIYTVLLHVSDENIKFIVSNLTKTAPVILVAEILGREWRRSGIPPVYNREEKEYVELFKKFGFNLVSHRCFLYERYRGWKKKNINMSFMKFKGHNNAH